MTKTEQLTNDLYTLSDIVKDKEKENDIIKNELEERLNLAIFQDNSEEQFKLDDLIELTGAINELAKKYKNNINFIEEKKERMKDITTIIEDLVYVDQFYDKLTEKIVSQKDEDYVSLLQVIGKDNEEELVCFGFRENAIDSLLNAEIREPEIQRSFH